MTHLTGTILLVDSDSVTAAAAEKVLAANPDGATVVRAAGTDEGLRLLSGQAIDAAVVRIESSEDGPAVSSRLRAASPGTAIVLLSAQWQEDQVEACLRAGAHDCLTLAADDLARLRGGVRRAVARQAGLTMYAGAGVQKWFVDAWEAAREPLLLCRADTGRILRSNTAATAAFGLDSEGLQTLCFDDLCSLEAGRPAALEILLQAARGGQFCEVVHRRHDGSVFVCEDIPSLVEHDNQPAVWVVVRDISERLQADREKAGRLHYFASMEKVNQAIQGSRDMEQMMRDVMDTLLEVFGCDRAWLVYPCDPDSPTWQVPMERTRPEFPGVLPIGVELPLDPAGGAVYRQLRQSAEPVQFGPGGERPVPVEMATAFSVQSFLATAFYPKLGLPWAFGLHQCTHARVWTRDEVLLFQEIGRRLADGLTSLLAYRDLRTSEQRYRELFENTSDVAVIVDVTEDGRFVYLDLNKAAEAIIGKPRSALIGRTEEDFPGDEDVRRFGDAFRCCLQSQAVTVFDEDIETQAGRSYLHTTLIPVADGSGRIGRILGVSHNVTEQKRAEAALRESEERFAAAFRLSPVAIAIQRAADGRFVLVNDAFCAVTGYSLEEIVGRTTMELGLWADPERQSRIMETLLSTGRLSGVEFRLRCKGGRIRIGYSDTARIVLGGEPHFLSLTSDITDRVQAEAQLNLLSAALRAAANAIVIVDRPGNIVWTNPAFTQLTGYTVEEAAGHNPKILKSGLMPPDFYQNLWSTILAGQVWRGEFINRRKDGSLYYEETTITPVRDERGDITHFIAVKEDRTERRQIEEKIRHVNRDLELRVAERTASLSHANAELKRLSKVKDDFLANMSHELRTPLNGILAMSEALEEGIYGQLSERQLRSVGTIRQSGGHLLQLINDVLDLAKIEAGRMELHPELEDVQAICQASLSMIRELAARKRQTVSLSIDPTMEMMRVDARALKQILVNLLSNAVKFTPEGGQIGLEVANNESHGTALFTVWDTGIGIAPDAAATLFQPFVQVDSGLARKYEGTGLGLALVERLARLQGGSVSLTSTPGQGSHFTVVIPRGQPGAQTAASQSAGSARAQEWSRALRERTILLADDNEATRETFAEYMTAAGYTVVLAADGPEALERARTIRPNLIIMDIQLPGMDGLDVIRALRALETFKAVPILAVTALTMPGDRERCLDAGATDYLSKPVGLKVLSERVRSLLENAAG